MTLFFWNCLRRLEEWRDRQISEYSTAQFFEDLRRMIGSKS